MSVDQIDDLLRQCTSQVIGALVRRYGHFDLAEDATQEALLAASIQWDRDGVPADPKAWLVRVAARRLTDLLRADQARRRREDVVAEWSMAAVRQPALDDRMGTRDDSLVLLFMCCHPSLSETSQIALTLRAIGGLTAAEIARGLLTSEQTITRRITRAKRSIEESGVPFAMPASVRERPL